jgi:hypothetical protein
MEAYRRAKGDRRARRKRMMDEEEKVDSSSYAKVEEMPRPKALKKKRPRS